MQLFSMLLYLHFFIYTLFFPFVFFLHKVHRLLAETMQKETSSTG